MAESSSIMGIVGAFIGIAIMLGIGTMILGNTTMDCSTLDGYNEQTPSSSTGWAATCLDNNTATQNAYALLIVILIVTAAVAILFVVKML
jgi:predicted lipid-binding transport protein (Tim44 family)